MLSNISFIAKTLIKMKKLLSSFKISGLIIVFFTRSYNAGLFALCDTGLLGLVLMLVSSAAAWMLWAAITWTTMQSWIDFEFDKDVR